MLSRVSVRSIWIPRYPTLSIVRHRSVTVKNKHKSNKLLKASDYLVEDTKKGQLLIEGKNNEWIAQHRNDSEFKYKSLNSIKDENSLYLKDLNFKSRIDKLVMLLGKSVMNQKVFANLPNAELYLAHEKVVKSLFEHKLAETISEFHTYDNESIELEDLISPTLEKLPYILYNLELSPFIKKYFELKQTNGIDEQELDLFSKVYLKETLQILKSRIPAQKINVDISNPAEWYPRSRKIKRKLIMHVGPTNSGKTYNALQRLKQSQNGYFAGPLRLLAREIYERFKSENIRCNLVTGEEIIKDLDEFGNQATLSSGTIEMIDMNTYFDVVILDEIQMISDAERGWAWTNALLGVRAKEVHLCGEASSIKLVQKIAELTGDEVIINEYDRLGELKMEESKIKGLTELKRGDCIVVFSKKKILTYKTQIEKQTNLKCAIVYGALPAETRVSQASKFNNGEYDVLIATDAIGMGLNLKINRIIFDDHRKFDGKVRRKLQAPHVKQIAGRAGRFKIAPNSQSSNTDRIEGTIDEMEEDLNDRKDTTIGYVTAFEQETFNHIRKKLKEPTQILSKATVWPSDEVWANYMSEFPNTVPFSTIIKSFKREVVTKSESFQIADIENKLTMVSEFNKIKGLLIADQLKISTAPISTSLPDFYKLVQEFGSTVANSQTKSVFQFKSLNFKEILTQPIPGIQFQSKKEELQNPSQTKSEVEGMTQYKELLSNSENLHKGLMVWLWMNIRYPTLFVDRKSASDLKNLLEDRIEDLIDNLRTKETRFKNE
ncbi:hypothetical protein WICMUC_003384 [Wickerhamomyces mucosus]|uniref:ATP-dependent RNA helicase SUV3, mitochondrial n=1 Tax=Wickerhamomyces mucosus TaxID=1378264 RepID=A0A9P8TCE9_9ASCO|nr:hypothetical protein WICMUC_003384 [Wickerhamomyces mucosus]